MRINVIVIVLTSFLLFGLTARHPFYLGITHLKYNSKEQTIQTSIKLFVNDLEDALKKLNKKPVDLINGKDKESLNKLLDSYLTTRFKLKINGKDINHKYLGHELEKEVVWIYMEYKPIKNIKTIAIENTLLYDFITQQTNIIRVEVDEREQNSKLNYPEKSVQFTF